MSKTTNTRVKLSAEGRMVFSQSDPDKLGTIIGESRTAGVVRVIWDGNKTSSSTALRFLERVGSVLVKEGGK